MPLYFLAMLAKHTKDLHFHSTVDGGGDGSLFIDFQIGGFPLLDKAWHYFIKIKLA